MFARSLMLGCIVCCGMSGFAVSDEPQATKPVAHKLARTYFVAGSITNGETVPMGYTNIDDPMPISCVGPNGCTIEIDAMVSVSVTERAAGWSICAVVDGVLVSNPPCAYQDQAVGYFTGNSRQSVQIAKGKHTVQTQIYNQGAYVRLRTWHIGYSVYRP